MQTLRKSAFSLGNVNKYFTRLVTLNSVEKKTSEDLKSWNEIPGPSSLPLIGQMHHFLPGGILSNRNDIITDYLYKKYGPIIRFEGHFGSSPIILLYDAEAASQILRGENLMPVRTGFYALEYYRNNIFKKESDPPDAPASLVTDNGDVWKKFRSTVNPVLLQPKTIKLYSESLKEVAEDMIKRMKQIRNNKNMLESEFDVEIYLWALESIGVVAFGRRINCFDPNLPEYSPAKKLTRVINDTFQLTGKLDFGLTLWRYFSTPTFKRAMKAYDEQIKICKLYIEKAREEYKTKKKSSNHEKGVLEKLLEIDERIALIMANDMILAGVDTTANTVMGILYNLAKNPDKQNKLREEITSKEEKQSYLKACIKESIRLMPVVPGNIRLTSKEYNILGYKIPEKMYVSIGHLVLGTMEQHYPRSKEFIPERWIVDKSHPLYYGNAHPFAASTFGFGVRNCIGRRIAELEMEIFISTFIKNFEVEWFGPRPEIHVSAVNYIKGPYNFVLKDV